MLMAIHYNLKQNEWATYRRLYIIGC